MPIRLLRTCLQPHACWRLAIALLQPFGTIASRLPQQAAQGAFIRRRGVTVDTLARLQGIRAEADEYPRAAGPSGPAEAEISR